MSGPERRMDRTDAVVLGLLVLVSIGAAAAALSWPNPVGWWEDDAVYLATAKALAEGHGYRCPHLPGEPWQTKYPPLYPSLLSIVWRVWPEFPANMALVRSLNAVLALGTGWLSYRLARRRMGVPGWIAGAGAALTLGGFYWQQLLGVAMSEHLYTFICFSALSAVARSAHWGGGSAGAAPSSRVTFVLNGLVVGLLLTAAALTRSAGLAVVGAGLISLCLARRWTTLTAASLVVVACLTGRSLWLWSAASSNLAIPGAGALAFTLGYGGRLPRDPWTLAWVAMHNTGEMAYALAQVLGPPPPWFTGWFMSGGVWREMPFLALLAGVVGLIGAGMAATWRRGVEAPHLFVLLSAGLILVWPFPVSRFLVPMLPLLTTWLLIGAACTADRIAAWATAWAGAHGTVNRNAPKRIGIGSGWGAGYVGSVGWTGGVLAGAVVCLLGARSLQLGLVAPGAAQAAEIKRNRTAAVEMLVAVTSEHGVVASGQGAYFHLVTGRKFVPLFPADDAVAEFYPPDRAWLRLGASDTPLRRAMFERMLNERLMEYYRATGVTEVCLPRAGAARPGGGGGKAASLAAFVEARASVFSLVRENSSFRLYRFR